MALLSTGLDQVALAASVSHGALKAGLGSSAGRGVRVHCTPRIVVWSGRSLGGFSSSFSCSWTIQHSPALAASAAIKTAGQVEQDKHEGRLPECQKRQVLCCASMEGQGASMGDGSEGQVEVLLGVDFGGSGIKGAPVDITTGQLLKERIRIPTPTPATPEAVAQVVKQLKDEFEWTGSIGIGMPSVVRRGLVRSAANIDKSWINIDARALYESATGCSVGVLNDADAAGYAEMAFGAGKEYRQEGVVLMTTFGTGIGTALFVDGNLVPNLELGHLEVDGEEAEKRASDRTREKEELSWKKWASRVNQVLARYEQYLQPDLIILGGGVSKKDDKFLHFLELPGGTPVVPAGMRNDAGIVGAAIGGAKILRVRDVVHSRSMETNGSATLHHVPTASRGRLPQTEETEDEGDVQIRAPANGTSGPTIPTSLDVETPHPWAL